MKWATLWAAVMACAGSSAMGATLQYGQRFGGGGAGWYFPGSISSNRIADDFVLGSAASLTSAEFWGRHVSGGSLAGMTFELSIWADEGPGLGVANAGLIHLESFAFGALTTSVSGGITKMSADFAVPIALSAGTKYWFSIGSDGGEDYVWVWQDSLSPDPFGTPELDADGGGDGTWEGPYGVQPEQGLGFALYGDSGGAVIPLPSAGAVAGIGLLGIGARRRRGMAA